MALVTVGAAVMHAEHVPLITRFAMEGSADTFNRAVIAGLTRTGSIAAYRAFQAAGEQDSARALADAYVRDASVAERDKLSDHWAFMSSCGATPAWAAQSLIATPPPTRPAVLPESDRPR